MMEFFLKFLIITPIYPHWLENIKKNQAVNLLFKNLDGVVLEVGAGDATRKAFFIKKNKKINKYWATDYSSWDSEFEKINTRINRLGKKGEIFFGFKTRGNLDKICSATDLPFKNNMFDYHISFDVLEHINNPFDYFSEATRVVKKGGSIIVSVPFLYRMHGGEPNHKMDYFRYANGFFYEIAEKNKLEVKIIHANTGFGTTLSSLSNQWIIRRIYESNILIKLILLIVSPFVFSFNNLIGYLIDIKPDKRFAMRFNVVFLKK